MLTREFHWDMQYRDEKLLDYLRAKADPETHRVSLQKEELALEFKCSHATIYRILHRFESTEVIKRLGSRRQPRLEIEVCLPSKPTSSI